MHPYKTIHPYNTLTTPPPPPTFSETLGGLPVIRSFQRQRMYRRQNELKLDDNVSAYYAMKSVDRWLSIRLEVHRLLNYLLS